MTQEYLQKYNFSEERFVSWLKAQGLDLLDGMNVLMTYAKEGRVFRSGDALCVQLVQDVRKLEMDRLFFASVEVGKLKEAKKSRFRKIWDSILGR